MVMWSRLCACSYSRERGAPHAQGHLPIISEARNDEAADCSGSSKKAEWKLETAAALESTLH